ncbi:polycystin-1 isoform X2 [Antechinus flavipes]|uniref:polycystin-1 isoform X2 n=1 Tax=Antechinus flavipes TaxID=38775 RepID=UPI002235C6EC|nr:polycystin-1 isoform X2 [Antechinus flavipes]
MPRGQGPQLAAPSPHGHGGPRPPPAPAPAPARLAFCLCLGLCIGGLSAAPDPGCQPCGLDCDCTQGPDSACSVNCSGRGLRGLGPELPIPPDVTSLDISDNFISTLETEFFENLSSLVQLDISNNKITTLEEGIFANLFNLSEINLSLNPFVCDCNLSWLPSWVEEQKISVVQLRETRCAEPLHLADVPILSVSFDGTCDEEYIACLQDNSSSTMAVVIFSAAHDGVLAQNICSAFCFSIGQEYGGLSEEGSCFCGKAHSPNASSSCLLFCSGLPASPAACRVPVILHNVFPASLEASLWGPEVPQPAGHPVTFNVSTLLPANNLRWDFGDGTSALTTGLAVSHRFILPGHYNVTADLSLEANTALLWTEVQVEAVPTELELLCPSWLQNNESLEFDIWNRGGTGLSAIYSITAESEQPARVVHPLCPSNTDIFPGNGHCYRLVVEKASWLQAQRHCQAWGGGDLAIVGSPEIQHFLVSQVTRSLDVWIGFTALSGPGVPPHGEAFSLESCQNWLPGEPHPANAEHCVRLGPAGQCNTDLCTATHSYVCEFQPTGVVSNAENFFVGDGSWDLSGPVVPMEEQDVLSAPGRETVEVMLFPGLVLQRKGFLTAAEFWTKDLTQPVQMRLQIYRPVEGGIPESTSKPSCSPLDNQTWVPLECLAGEHWCPLANMCLPLDSPCSISPCANDSSSKQDNHWSSYYSLWREFLFSIPAGPSLQYSVSFSSKNISLLPGDLFSVQHDAGPGALLRCLPHPEALSHQQLQPEYLSANVSTWLPSLPAHLSGASSSNGTTCALRLLFASEQVTRLLGQLINPGLQHVGHYVVRASVDNSVSSHNLSCSFDVLSPVVGLRIIHPTPQDGRFYVSTNWTYLVLKISSGVNSTASQLGSNQSVPFEASCPPGVVQLTADCIRETNDTWFALLELDSLGEDESLVEIVAENHVSRENISIQVKAEEPIRGLSATPNPQTRVLQSTLVRYSPIVDAGSDVVFKWTIDDKQSLTFYNIVFNVIYQSAAVFKLSLTASNHVSNVTVNYNVTVEKMNKMRDLVVSEVPAIIPQNTTLQLGASVQVDSAVEVAFLWTFGDGEQESGQFKPPYNESFLAPEPGVHQVLIEHNVTHTYHVPGDYNLTVFVFNTFENLTQQLPLSVRASLPHVTVETDGGAPVVGRPITFTPRPLPSPTGVSYTWDFGDGSPVVLKSEPAVSHAYGRRGVYNISLTVNNTVSSVRADLSVRVFEEIWGLRVSPIAATEKGMAVTVNASVEAGDNITWTFDMGDGTVLTGPEPSVQHVYLQDENCTLQVTAANPVSSVSQLLPVHIFVLEVLKIEPTSCIPEQPEVQLTAHVTGDYTHYVFDWTFGDGSSNATVHGRPTVTHNFTRSGTFPLSLVLSSLVNKAHYFTSVCVEPEVSNVTLRPERQFVKLGEEARLEVQAFPPFFYHFSWDFGANDSARSGGTEVSYTYKVPGIYLVTVTVSNNVSSDNDTAFVEVQEPVGISSIEVNGSHVLELNQPYLFSVRGSGSPASYSWDLGDGRRQESPQVVHAFNRTGTYTVSVLGWNEVSRSESQLNVTVKRRVQGLSVNASRTVVPLNGSVSFSTTLQAGSDVHYSWVLCDRCTPIPGSSTISYTFRSVGTFNIIVTAENEVSSLQDSIFIYVLQQIEGLQMLGGGDRDCFPTNRTLQLQAAVRDGTNISYSWTVQQDGALVHAAQGKVFPLTVPEAGTYHVQLRAVNMLGSAAVNRTFEFVENMGQLALSASPNPTAVNTSVNISAALSSGTGITYSWLLQEGVRVEAADPSVTHAFPSPGLWAVTVVAKNQLGSVNGTILVDVQEPVAGLGIGCGELGHSFVVSGSVVHFWGDLEHGSNVSWSWEVLDSTKSGQRMTEVFPSAGAFSIHLNASNAVSWTAASCNITVEDPIQGLELWASSRVVEPGEKVHFSIHLALGSDVSYRLLISGGAPTALGGPSFSHSFPKVGDYMVTVQAENHVSREQVQVRISVLEAIAGLQIVGCCELGIPTGGERNFTARVQRGSRVSYAWDFSLQKVQGDSLVILSGREVAYTPVAAGHLEIHVRAFNDLGSVNLTRTIEVQDLIQAVDLHPGSCFTNRSAQFEAATMPSPRRVSYHWDFGDGSQAQVTSTPLSNHTYLFPGDYHIQVNASNLVSFLVAKATVTVRVLECEEPEVEVALPTQVVMRRSQRSYLEAHINLRGCVTYQTEYHWQVYRAASCLHYRRSAHVPLPGVDVSRPQLVVPRLALAVGDYCFVFVVSFGDTPLSRSIQANVTVTPGRLVPIIDGGSYRVWSNTRDLVLNGGKSYDPNLEDGDQTLLSFHWACVSSSKSHPGGCPLNFGPRGSSMITIPKERLEAGVEYTFNLTVWKAGRKEEVTNQTVLIRNGLVPIVSLECVSCKAQSVYEVSKSSYVYLEGTCHNCSSGSKRGRWAAQTFSNKSLVLDESTTSTGSSGMRLVLRRGVLRDGEGYTFTLTVLGCSGEEEGFASIDLFPNRPPIGGSCRLFPHEAVKALTTKVHFECTGWRDTEDEDAPLVYSLLLRRCRQGYCEEFCIYKGSLSAYGAVLPPGFKTHFTVDLSVVVQDQLGAAVVALNRSLLITLPEPSAGFHCLTHWLYSLTETVLPGLVKQADPQHVIEYSLALITVLNEYEQVTSSEEEASHERHLRVLMRRNITEILVSLRVNTVDDIQQISAALAQCTVASKEFVCHSCLKKTLNKLENMMAILQNETTQGTVTPTAIADNILNITGDLIHLVNSDTQGLESTELYSKPHNLLVASKAYNLSSDLMRILMKSRVLNEEPLTLAGEEIVARGKRSDPFSLLCYENTSDCQFSIPPAFNSTFSDLTDVIQLIFLVDSNPFPFGYISNYTVSTKVASMAFQTQAGAQIPIERLGSEKAITVKVSNNTSGGGGDRVLSTSTAIIQPRTSVSAIIAPENHNPEAGLHFQLTYTVLNERYLSEEPEPFLAVYLHSAPQPNEYNCTASKKIGLKALTGGDHRLYTFFISPGTDDTTASYYLNMTSHFHWSEVEVTVGLYTSLCQYFNEKEMMWKTEGIVPLEETSPSQAVCLTRHLTAFGASLFVPPSSIQFIFPEPAPGINYIVLLTCAVCLATYAVTALIVHKLDLMDVSRVSIIPFCGKNGRFKYEILVKTGWGQGSGTTAHVGITLYGADGRSGHRHLDGESAFHRNSLDIFQIATQRSLGSVWKIRVWHDNKGLSPAWFLQHIIVRDLQTGRSAFFLVNDWLSVETEDNGGLVEKEVLAASDATLRRFPRLLTAELQRGFFEKHIWLSLWDRPPRSRFTRVQRATCCALLICLFLGANAVWYGVVGDVNHSNVPMSSLIPLSVDTVAVGLVSSVVVYPLYLVILFLFRMSRSKAFSGQTKTDLFLDDSKSLMQWQSSDGTLSWPDLLSDPSIMGNTLQRLVRAQAGNTQGLEVMEEDGLSLGNPPPQTKYFSTSDEDLIRQILAEGANSIASERDTHLETDLLTGLSGSLGVKTETLMLQRLNEKGLPHVAAPQELAQSAKFTREGLAEGLQKRLLPPWCAPLAHGLSLLLVLAAVGISGWIGTDFTSSVGVMWLISGIFSFLSSFLVWEPLKVLLEALYFSLVAKRLHPEEDDTLVECPAVEPVCERIPRVRPPQGFALFQAKEEARKVKLLHRMLKNFLVYMLFLLVTLLTNYGDASNHTHAYRLQSSIKQELDSKAFLGITRSDEFWVWMSRVLLPYVHGNQSALELGPPRLRQVRLQEALCPDALGTMRRMCTTSGSFSTQDYEIGWESSSPNGTRAWAYSAPDLAGVWYWGYFSVYDSGGYIQELGVSLEESRELLSFLQRHNWIDNMSRAVFVELTQYSPAVGLHAAVTLRLEFPVSGRALTAISVRPFPLQRLSAGVTLQLLMMVFLMLFVVYFVVAEALAMQKEGQAYLVRAGAWGQWLLILLTTATVLIHLSQLSLADQQWGRYLKRRPHHFTSFYQVAQLSSAFASLAASLLFLLMIKAAQQLRFIRQWSVFGKTLYRSVRELVAAGLALLVLAIAYTQLGFMLFSSCADSLRSTGWDLFLLCPAGGDPHLCPSEPWRLSPLLCTSLTVLQLWGALRLGAVVLRRRYHALRGELYRPAWEPQDYEMVELFLRRLRLWMGFSKVKEFRHKVRFEGMEPLPSRSSSDSKSSQDVSPPSAGSDTSRPSTSSSQLDGMSLLMGRAGARGDPEPEPSRLLSVFEALLTQFDRLNQATEEVYQLEQRLQGLQGQRSGGHLARPPWGLGPPTPSPSPGPSLGIQTTLPARIARASRGMGVAAAHSSSSSPLVKASIKAKNRIHPSLT